MTSVELHGTLARIGRDLNRWQAAVVALFGLAGAAALLGLLTLSDMLFRYERTGRLIACGVWAVALLVGLGFVLRALRRRRTAAGVAAIVERTFPALDNHLINTVLFAEHPAPTALEQEYLQRPLPGWAGLDLRALRNRKAERLGALAAALMVVLLAAPLVWTGASWSTAALRILNPLSDRRPISLTRFLTCAPGNATVQKGDALTLACRVQGRGGQTVYLDLWPADDKPVAVKIGRLTGSAAEDLAHAIPKVAADFRYRFRAGDGETETYRIQARAPLAFAHIGIEVAPPDYTGLLQRTFDALADPVEIPQGATASLTVECTEPLRAAALTLDGSTPSAMRRGAGGRVWSASLTVLTGTVFRISGTDADRRKVDTEIQFALRRDLPPEIRVLAPVGKAALGPGAVPSVGFEVADEYGLQQVELQRVRPGAAEGTNGTPLCTWPAVGGRLFVTNWMAGVEDFTPGQTNLYRIVARDNAAGSPNVSRSALIVFTATSPAETLRTETAAATGAVATLAQLIELQRNNLEATKKLTAAATAAREQWKAIGEQQVVIRHTAGQLLDDPQKPLASLTETVRQLHANLMNQVIDVVARVPAAPDTTNQTALAQLAVKLESLILSQLTFTESGLGKVQENQKITGILAMLDALVRNQEDVLTRTRTVEKAKTPVAPALVDRQDRLASDLNDFVQVCRREAENLQRSDAVFAKSMVTAADTCESRKVNADMLRAAEQLEQSKAAEAIPPELTALTTLKEIQAQLNEWRMAEAKEKLETLQEEIAAAKEKLQNLIGVQSKVVDAIRATAQQKDKSDKDADQLQEEVEEIKANMEEAVAQLAKDLHILPELPVGNDLVEDVSQVYEEMKQVKGSDKEKATELGLQKEDFILDMLKMAAGRMDDMEMWLTAKPDATKRNTENFDKQEMPKITTMPMPTEMEDIIGDLLKQQDDIKDKADDSASNQGSADMPAGWDIAEGEYVNYSAKGKSGNERPDHREIDGRSNIGREGMSEGETVAGSGKINAGDEKIEKRRTQDSAQSGQVQEDGHAKAKATGGGKLAGYGEEKGMSGGTGPRRDSAVTQPSLLGLQALLRRDTEAVYAKATLMHIRTGSLDIALRNMRLAEDGLNQSLPIRQIAEFQRRAAAALRKTQTELGTGLFTDAGDRSEGGAVDDQVATSSDEAPPQYRDLVSEYYKSLNQKP